MADRIKGITIEFKGNATQLQKTIRDTNKEIGKTQKELTAVNKALKFNPTSIELWRQKQELLTKKVDQTKTQLEQLKQAQKQMDASGVDKNSAEYRKLQREIVETESKLKTFKAQLHEVGNYKLKALSEGFKLAGDKMTTFGTTLTKNVTAPIIGIGTAAVAAFNEVQNGLNIVAQKTGATGDELKAMQDIVRETAKEIPATYEEIGNAVGEVNTRFNVNGTQLEDLSEKYLKFAKVNGVDVTNAIDGTQKALAAWGLGADAAPGLLDMLTRASQKTGVSVETLTSGLIQNGTALQEMNLSLPQSIEFMAQLDKSGANSETVMQGLRKALKNAAAEGIPLDQALLDLQNTIENGTGSMDGLTAAYDLFGKSGDQIYGAVKNGTLDFTALAGAVEDSGGTLDRVFEETLTPAEKFQTTLNSLKDAGYEIGGTIMTVLEPALKKISEKMKELSEWWGNLSPETQEAITKALMIAAAIGPIILILGKLATAIGAIIGIVNTVGSVIGLVSAGPMVAIVAAIAAIIAIGVLLYKNWDTIKEKMKALGEIIKNGWESVKSAISNAAKSIYDKMTYPFRKAWEFIQGIIEKIKGWFPIDIGNFFGKIKLPHLTIKGEFSLNPPSVPSIGIDWYDKGGIFTSPTVIGVGEKRPEFVGALDDLRQIVRDEAGGSGVVINVYASPGMNEEELARKVEQKLVQFQKQRSMAYGGI